MTDFDNRNRFVLFKNDKKTTDKHPDYTGNITMPDGTRKRMAAWIKEGKNGKFMSGMISDFQQDAHNQAKSDGFQPQGEPQGGDFSDDIPFSQFRSDW